jgi:glycine cleavage system aminomethyltransferase T
MLKKNNFASLQELIDSKSDLVDYFYNDTLAPHVKDRAGLTPVPMEFTTWREEQRAWREAAVFFDQSHHMPETFVTGPDAFRFLNRIGVNSFANFVPGNAKQFVGCNSDGHIIGECVLFYLAENSFELVSGMHFQNWVEYQASLGEFDVTLERDQPTYMNPDGRRNFRFGMDGPNAEKIFKEVVEGEAPEIRFFNTAKVKIAGCDVLALRHGMAGHKGVELAGAYADGPKVLEALQIAGKKHGLRRGGTIAYFSACAEGGWMAYPLPAIYTSEDLRAYREWLPATGWEASSQLGGSFRSSKIEDYYLTPWDLGYDRLVKFDHDFIGREALEKSKDEPRRTAVTLVLSDEDVAKVFRSQFETGTPYKAMNMPIAYYAFQQNDEVRDQSGNVIGLSAFCGYSVNERKFLALAMVSTEHAEPGTEAVLIWGEPNGGSRKPHVEEHRQTEIRVTIAPAPYARAVQEMRSASLSR